MGKFKSLKVFGKRKIVLDNVKGTSYNHKGSSFEGSKKALGMHDAATAYLPTLSDNKAYSYYHTWWQRIKQNSILFYF